MDRESPLPRAWNGRAKATPSRKPHFSRLACVSGLLQAYSREPIATSPVASAEGIWLTNLKFQELARENRLGFM